MEITAQTPITTSVGSTSGGTAFNSGSSSSGFSTTLNGMLVSGNPQAGTDLTAAGTSLSALMGLLAPFLTTSVPTDESAAAMNGEQIDGLIQLLEQTQDGAGGNPLLSNPDLQAWLAQLQEILTALAANMEAGTANGRHSEEEGSAPSYVSNDLLDGALNPMLFIPLTAASPRAEDGGNQYMGGTLQAGISQAEAVQLLKQLREMVEQGKKDPQLQQSLKELPAVLMSAAVTESDQNKGAERSQRLSQTSLIMQPATDAESSETQEMVSIVTNPLNKLEMLAAKHTVAMHSAEQPTIQADNLFEPLIPADSGTITGQQPAMSLQDWMKGVQAGLSMPKHPVLQMSAGTFANDLTQFVVSSFSLQTSSDGLTEARISLFPQHLGHVEVKLTMQNGLLVAQIMADSLSGKEMLESQLAQLRSTLQSQGIQIEKLEVSQSQNFQSGMFQEGRQQQSGQSSKQNKSGSSSVASIEEEQGLETKSNMNTTVDGRGSIDVTA
ncbi:MULTISPECIES: flagellar hook-length control protein FliK [unclassified Paenibacillus]|uniref:flagellar hook-length control protein FliK n=1 Tax=unclassified Paenibacillus TaxID=185978 RepID=UPI001AE94987|nr:MULTISPECIES: flagellar hook-length control protein FliK [unclassified Paenibacillus]MBP1156005.1 flagellar hook-length control protein FliK [Paenibacillus sp. PvP091]MBP1168609.1 flagellar hook-length control protein FliK [Paenibacillus sp. PvR098]MBP2439637.1 flagellar hook-length control protein FliK [Paenibacillus sp. PvP052]